MRRGNGILARINRLKRLRKGIDIQFDNEHPLPSKNPFGMNNFVGAWNEPILFQQHLRRIQKGRLPRRSNGQFAPMQRAPSMK